MSWNKLKQGDAIELIAPSSGKLEHKLFSEMKAKFKEKGFQVILPPDLFSETLFCANTDNYRYNHFNKCLHNDDVKAIWCIRGGYGSARLLPLLNQVKKAPKEKIFIGFSDATALHLFLNQKWGWKTIHAPTAWQIIDPGKDQNNFDVLFGLLTQNKFSVKIPLDMKLNKHVGHHIKGKLSGGNLSLIQTSIGTDWQMEAADKIIFLEDWKEEGYRIDRMLEHLFQANMFVNVKALIFGDMLDKEGVDSGIEHALQRFANKVDFPVFKTSYFGHGRKNYPLVYSANAEIVISDNGLFLEYNI